MISSAKRIIILAGCLAAVVLLGLIDYVTGFEISFSIFYLIPVCVASWYASFGTGIIVAVVSMISWYWWDFSGGHQYSMAGIVYWNALSRGMIFGFASYLLAQIRQIINEMNKAKRAAVEASDSKSVFLANMSHEIRTPLNALLGMAELLSHTSLDSEQKKYVTIFRKEGDQLLRILNDILDLSRVEAGKFEPEVTLFDLRQVIEEVVSVMGEKCRERKLDINLEVDERIPTHVSGAPFSLRRILMNLVGNAVKFTEKGGVAISCKVQNTTDDTCNMLFSVKDTGIGIPEEKLKILFLPFTQADETIGRKYGGSGLGLSIIRKLLDVQGGRIWVESVPDQGSIFYFEVPYRLPDHAEIDRFLQADPDSVNNEMPVVDRELNILVADDYETNRLLIKSFFKDTRYRIEEAANGHEVLKKYQPGRFDLILMDMRMPLMDGYTAAASIRRLEQVVGAVRTPIIAVTAAAYKEEIWKCLDSGCDNHLAKPLNSGQLHRVIARLFENGSQSAAVQEGSQISAVFSTDPEMQELLSRYLVEVRSDVEQVKSALNKTDFSKIITIGHRLKGSGGSFGLPELSEAGVALETAASEKNKARVENLVVDLSE
ncbi:MAG: ATP-binding protein [Candidatus Wallbacteria bacterium]|nr:ATP-binding protein [Candidatus Wallbacteria bacterium]